jgi:hypothetical protein
MPARDEELTEEIVIARGGWHPRYARTLAIAADGDYGLAIVDGNGDGAELETEAWLRDDDGWSPGSSSGAGPLDYVGSLQSGGEVGDARFAYGCAIGAQSVRITFDGHVHEVPVGREGVWAFIKSASGPHVAAPALAP